LIASPLIVVESRRHLRWHATPGEVVTANEFIADDNGHRPTRRSVINLCRSYDYLSVGYHCSLLAEARGQRVLPSVDTILGLGRAQQFQDRAAALVEQFIGPAVVPSTGKTFSLRVYLGQTIHPALRRFAQALFRVFGCPLLSIRLVCDAEKKWRVHAIKPLSVTEIPSDEDHLLVEALSARSRLARIVRATTKRSLFDLAILHDPNEALAPSKGSTLDHMARVAEALGVAVTLIGSRDLNRLSEFDGLFIRQTTSIANATFQFARRAEELGMPVVDDVASIVHCTNKAYLADLLPRHRLMVPRTHLVTRQTTARKSVTLPYPVVLKTPDGCFSTNVKRAESPAEFGQICDVMLRHSEVILAQEFVPTDYDWRIGVLGHRPLFAARYFMCKNHWQIIRHAPNGTHEEGRTEAVPIEMVPVPVLDAALRAAALIGDGLYGVDLKQNSGGVYVIEINDNPNIDVGMEDTVLGDELYRRVLRHFLDRAERPGRRGLFRTGSIDAPADPPSTPEGVSRTARAELFTT
jgi:glutathione synthase/RimK-type ligase-like ATP-grasp enzyme